MKMSLLELKYNFLDYCTKFDDIIKERTQTSYGSDLWKELTIKLSSVDETRKEYAKQFRDGIKESLKDKTDEEKISILVKVAENAFPSYTFIGNKNHIISLQRRLNTDIPEYKISLDGTIQYFDGNQYTDFYWNLNSKFYIDCWIL